MNDYALIERRDHPEDVAAMAARFGDRFTTSRDVCKLHGNSSGIRIAKS